MISIRQIQAIVREYPAEFQPGRIEPLGAAGGMSGAQFWRVASPAGVLLVRRWPREHPTAERLRFIHDVVFHAAERGVKFLAVPLRTNDGRSFVVHDGQLWEMAPWLPGIADYEQTPTPERLRSAMRALARFHAAVSSYPVAATQRFARAPAIARHLSRLQSLLFGDTDELRLSISDAPWPELGPLGRKFCDQLTRCLPRAIALLEPLLKLPYSMQPCLRDIWHDHVLFTGEEVTGMIDYGGMDIDTPATDIARLLGSLVADDEAGWSTGLTAYADVRPLSSDEILAAKALDTSGTILAGCNWLRWIYVDGRSFEDRAQVAGRFRRIVERVCT